MKVLVLRPPQILSYFNAGHHVALYQTAQALTRLPLCQVDCLDAAVETVTWKDMADRLFLSAYDVIFLMNDLDGTDAFPRTIKYARELSPQSRIATFGRFSAIRPSYFRQFDIDVVIRSGDFEAVSCDVVQALRDGSGSPVPGTDMKLSDAWLSNPDPGRLVDPADWILPDPSLIPYRTYDKLYGRDSARFSGLPGRTELVVPVARGCPVGCSFCEVPTAFGRRDRRIPVGKVIDYIERSFAEHTFGYVSFYAPTFTIDRGWVKEFCAAKQAAALAWEWKCCTTLHHLDREMVMSMGAAGCVRISVGVESLETAAAPLLPRLKQKTVSDVRDLASWCDAAGVELNCFVIVGLPGTTVAGAQRTIRALQDLSLRVRPTVYTPYEEISAQDSPLRVMDFNRQLLNFSAFESPREKRAAYALLCTTNGRDLRDLSVPR